MKSNAIFLIALVLLTLLYIASNIISDSYGDIESGKSELYCFIKGKGYTKIPKDKIIGYIYDTDTWIFVNGYAKNCKIIKINE